MALKPIQILINAKDEASSVFDKLQNKVAAVGAAILTYFGVKSFVGVVQGAADLEQALSRVQAATGATADEMAQLREAAEGAAAGTKFTAVDTTTALENLAKAGLNVKDSIAALPAVMALAEAGDVELGRSAEYVTKAVMGMGLAFDDAGRVADVLAKGATATNTSVEGLAQALSYAAPVANSLGLSLESTVAILGKFADAGIDASRAGTALNSILSQFSDPASKFRRELSSIGITTNDFEKALRQLAKAGPEGQKAIAAVGLESGPALRAMLNIGMGALDDLTESLRNSQGSAAEMAAVMRDNLPGAMNGLRSAWDAVSNALGTPVLPILKDGVQQLTTALREAVDGGTATKFGNAIATAFQSGITWAKNFAASFDVNALVARLQKFADDTQQTFDKVGQWATNAGNIVKTAWGVMSAGSNTVLAVIYKAGEVWASFASTIQDGVALILRAFAKVTFGDISTGFKRAADEVQQSADATAGVAEEFGKRAAGAFEDATEGAHLAREGFAGLTGAMQEGEATARTASAAMGQVATQLQATADANAKAAEQTRATSAAQQEQAQKAEQARAAYAQLRAEYAQAINTGDVQRAAELMGQLKKATDGAALSAKENKRAQEDAAAALAAAFRDMGVQTREELQKQANNFKASYELIRDSGEATGEVLQAAFKKAAEAAIAASNGTVPEWVKAEAAALKYNRAVVEANTATQALGSTDLGGLVSGLNKAADAASSYKKILDDAAAATAKQSAIGVMPNLASDGVRSTQFSGDTRYAGAEIGSLTAAAAFLKAAGVDDDAVARAIARDFGDANGNIRPENNPGMKKYGGDTITQALLRAAEAYTFGTGAGAKTIPKEESSRTVRHEFIINGQSRGSAVMDAAGSNVLAGVLEELSRSQTVSSYR